MRNKWMLLPAVVCMLLVDSCTDAGLCEDATHAVHEGNVRMNYVWPEGTTPPDSMTIMAVRVVNHRKFGMIVSTENLRGHYFYNAPSNVTELQSYKTIKLSKLYCPAREAASYETPSIKSPSPHKT